MNTENWRIREVENMFWIEADLPKEQAKGNSSKVELMQDNFSGYTEELRRADAELIIRAPKMQETITEIHELLKDADLFGSHIKDTILYIIKNKVKPLIKL